MCPLVEKNRRKQNWGKGSWSSEAGIDLLSFPQLDQGIQAFISPHYRNDLPWEGNITLIEFIPFNRGKGSHLILDVDSSPSNQENKSFSPEEESVYHIIASSAV